MLNRVGLGWHIGIATGWGTYGLNLAVQLATKGITPGIFFISPAPSVTQAQVAALSPALEEIPKWQEVIKQSDPSVDFPFLHGLSDKLVLPKLTKHLKGKPDVGVIFFESAVMPPDNLAAAQRFALIITGSTWNTEVLKAHGFNRVMNCPQGVDLALFNPGPRQGHFKGRFAIFSGGKLEFRKGQDLVVAAFKRFHATHPDALLVTAWHNFWPENVKTIGLSRRISGVPEIDDQRRLNIPGWLKANGLPDGSFFHVGELPNLAMGSLLREVDLAVFPNRCEGGTNLVAMECMASGVPVVLSRNTGHLDLIEADNCYTLDAQASLVETMDNPDLEGWGESSVDELVARMTDAYDNRAAAVARGQAGAAFMKSWDWSTQVDRLIDALKTVS